MSSNESPANVSHESDLLESLSRVDVRTCTCVAVAGPEDRARVMETLLRAMAPKDVQVVVDVTRPATAETWEAVVGPLLHEIGLSLAAPNAGHASPNVWLDVDLADSERKPDIAAGARARSPSRHAVCVGDPFDHSAPLGLRHRGPNLMPHDPGADATEQRWRFAIGWMRSLCQAFMRRAPEEEAL